MKLPFCLFEKTMVYLESDIEGFWFSWKNFASAKALYLNGLTVQNVWNGDYHIIPAYIVGQATPEPVRSYPILELIEKYHSGQSATTSS